MSQYVLHQFGTAFSKKGFIFIDWKGTTGEGIYQLSQGPITVYLFFCHKRNSIAHISTIQNFIYDELSDVINFLACVQKVNGMFKDGYGNVSPAVHHSYLPSLLRAKWFLRAKKSSFCF